MEHGWVHYFGNFFINVGQSNPKNAPAATPLNRWAQRSFLTLKCLFPISFDSFDGEIKAVSKTFFSGEKISTENRKKSGGSFHRNLKP
jgi:hypothetical protein